MEASDALLRVQATIRSHKQFLLEAIARGEEAEQRWWAGRLLAAFSERARLLSRRNETGDRLAGRHRARAQFTRKAPEEWGWQRIGRAGK